MDFLRSRLIFLWSIIAGFAVKAFFIVGVILVIAEMVVPGVGLLGICGTACIIIAILIFSESIIQAIILSALAIAIIAVLLFLSEAVFAKMLGVKRKTNRKSNSVPVCIDEKLIGKIGTAKTDIAPKGTAELSEGDITVTAVGNKTIYSGEKIKIEGIKGGTVFVEKIEDFD